MTNDFDARILAALDTEQRQLLADIGEEPGYFAQLPGLFSGKTWWAAAMLMLFQTLIFIAALWASIHFFRAETVLDALRWGLPAAVGMLASLTMKLVFWPQLHINRLERQLKRIEALMVARH